MIYYSKKNLYNLKANSFLYSSLLISNTLNDVMGKSSVSETPFHAWVTRGTNYYLHTEGSFTTGDLVKLPEVTSLLCEGDQW